jgi:uncharacterized membrane protein
MALLILGLLLFCGIHLIPALAPAFRASWQGRLGERGYRGAVSLLLLGGVALMVFGWRSALPSSLYLPPPGLHAFALVLLVIAFLLLVVSVRPSRLRQWVRHPQLTGVLLWAIAHLLLNGDSRSLVLFGGLALWALVEIVAISRREGAWVKGATPGVSSEVINLAITAVVLVAVVHLHPYLAGMPVH